MSDLAKRVKTASYSVELATFETFAQTCLSIPGLCWDFFHESQYAKVAEYDPLLFGIAMERAMENGSRYAILGRANGEVVGFIVIDFARFFTKEPLAHLFIVYVKPEWRASPLGRMLVLAAVGLAEAKQVRAFYAGITSGISEENTARLGNMFRRLGFGDVGITLKKVVRA
jgi:ribosomal protein S18 acetylase RimI-like enzyme